MHAFLHCLSSQNYIAKFGSYRPESTFFGVIETSLSVICMKLSTRASSSFLYVCSLERNAGKVYSCNILEKLLISLPNKRFMSHASEANAAFTQATSNESVVFKLQATGSIGRHLPEKIPRIEVRVAAQQRVSTSFLS